MTTDPNDPTTPQQPAPGEPVRPSDPPPPAQPVDPPAQPAQPVQPVQPAQPVQPQQPAQAAPAQPVAAQPVAAQPGTPVQPTEPVAPGEQVEPVRDDRPRIDAGRYAGGALAAIVVSALVAWVLHFVLTDLAGLTVLGPPDLLGIADDTAAGERNAYALDTALVALVAAIVLALLAAAPRPRLFFGWIMVLLAIIAVAVPLSRGGDIGEGVATALLNLVIVAAIWSLLAGVAGRAIRPERLTPNRA